jgi:hypothetical protein
MDSNLTEFDDRFIPHYNVFLRDIHLDLAISELVRQRCKSRRASESPVWIYRRRLWVRGKIRD